MVAGAAGRCDMNLHPFLVHFPIALTLSCVVLFLLARIIKREDWAATLATVATFNLCLGAVAILLAVMSGVAAAIDLNVDEIARHAITAHVKWAIFTSVALLLLAVWRGAGTVHTSRPSTLFLLVLLVAGLAIYMTGYRGVQNVFEHGVGVEFNSAKK
jgi:uncharacterized membrane protein